MSPNPRRLLHVEPDQIQQRVIAQHLTALPEFAFDILTLDSEDQAIAAFQQAKFDLVVLDCQLPQGDGLRLLRRIRQLDPIIPIIAISGVATTQIAAELVQAGADDYFEKQHLDSGKLGRAIRDALQHADVLSRRADRLPAGSQHIENDLLELCRTDIERLGEKPLDRLTAVESEIRKTQLGTREFEMLYDRICCKVEMQQHPGSASARALLRPLFLDLLFRLERDAAGESSI